MMRRLRIALNIILSLTSALILLLGPGAGIIPNPVGEIAGIVCIMTIAVLNGITAKIKN